MAAKRSLITTEKTRLWSKAPKETRQRLIAERLAKYPDATPDQRRSLMGDVAMDYMAGTIN